MKRHIHVLGALVAVAMLATSACSNRSSRESAPQDMRAALDAAAASAGQSSESGAAGFPLPRPIGHVNDHAGVIPDSTARFLEDTLRRIRTSTEGEIAIVTFADLGEFKIEDIARRIGNEWGVGATTGRERHAGTVVLLVPRETASDGRGRCRIELGEGANTFITDSMASSICVAATPSFKALNYGEGLRLIALDLAQRYVKEFGSR